MSSLGAIAGPISELIYFRDYWLPESLFYFELGNFPIMAEDIIFGWCIGGIATIIYVIIVNQNTYNKKRHRGHKKHVFIVLSIFALTLLLCLLLNLNSIYASAVAFVIPACYILYKRHDLFLNALVSGLGVMSVMFVCYLFVFSLINNVDDIFRQGWLIYGSAHDIRLIANIPLTEMIWGFTMGFFVGPLYEFIYQKNTR